MVEMTSSTFSFVFVSSLAVAGPWLTALPRPNKRSVKGGEKQLHHVPNKRKTGTFKFLIKSPIFWINDVANLITKEFRKNSSWITEKCLKNICRVSERTWSNSKMLKKLQAFVAWVMRFVPLEVPPEFSSNSRCSYWNSIPLPASWQPRDCYRY